MHDDRTSEPVALVTGANRGIGAAALRALRARGVRAVGTYRTDPAPDGGFVRMDVRSDESVQDGVAELRERFGRPSIVVCNAGVSAVDKFARMSVERFLDVCDANAAGAIRVVNSVLSDLVAAPSSAVVLVGSLSGTHGSVGNGHYAAAKAALGGYARALAVEHGDAGLSAMVVAPGFVDTDMLRRAGVRSRSMIVPKIPRSRFASPDEVGELIAALTDPRARALTNSIVHVDGGMGMGW